MIVCPKCNGKRSICNDMWICDVCKGTGKVPTNEEWIKSATTEELAEIVYNLVWLSNELFNRLECSGEDNEETDLKIVREWLKQPHKPKE